jgi:hypothetical protein
MMKKTQAEPFPLAQVQAGLPLRGASRLWLVANIDSAGVQLPTLHAQWIWILLLTLDP